MRCSLLIALMLQGLLLCACGPRTETTVGKGSASTTLSHRAFDEILRRQVDSQGLVDYVSLQKDDRVLLDAYLNSIAATDPASLATREDRLAYWLNAYNAFVIAGVLDRYPMESVQKVEGFFKEKRYLAGGKTYSLDEIENEIIRPTFEEPRIHFILVCAAKSCPRLGNRAMDPSSLEKTLEESARGFINSANGVRVNEIDKKLEVSALFKWYRKDFEQEAGSVIDYLLRYLNEPPPDIGDYEITFLSYDWALNEQAQPVPANGQQQTED
ncbi:MAG: DUF547 domain-containing protein [Armatimonadetes bacterium]|nr:DUF547 domain-containing protein [Armatimonadota bacterium]NIM24061.1 DUF547 domain-containing protein [Armatimonadota bacterium]NIM67915.1 DUF547 domain-containing protein [Armatimonadota bacterium]NIM76437.1 DUF547 domain-containing protein [Armatimonadota bacterium]NIN06145.1 DUF547 domain-containing protein [Armatimonadota bacterium]